MKIGYACGVGALSSLLATTIASASTLLPLPDGCEVAHGDQGASVRHSLDKPAFPPVQMAVSTPFEPTAFAAGGYQYLVYELHLQNYSSDPLNLKSIEVVDASDAAGRLIVSLAGQRLYQKMVDVGAGRVDGDHPLNAGGNGVALICIAFNGTSVPERISHRVLLDGAVAEGAAIGTRHDDVKALGPPVAGRGWIADNGLSINRHHRPGLFVAGGMAQIARRYAIDWKKRIDGAFSSGDELDVRSYHAYGQQVLAVADATVVSAKDGVPDNIPRTAAGFATAVPITMETVAGNAVVLDLGGGQFAYYAHLKPGSVRVKANQRVLRGQPLAEIGNSGDARWPHLHFQVTTSPDILASEGVPYVFDRYRIKLAEGSWESREREFPLDSGEIDFAAGEAERRE